MKFKNTQNIFHHQKPFFKSKKKQNFLIFAQFY
ncbi:hypothetical protein L931_05220 [Helicobacter pylori PZ5024]|uniref:Uncharacterized protein n=1 Tax=Helicobacter pylori PZ5024 TaxID=1337391 RepID=T2T4G3_HELPX|nr:hypothetical protein L931_05220 [Helicobacter pylori PZ5024]